MWNCTETQPFERRQQYSISNNIPKNQWLGLSSMALRWWLLLVLGLALILTALVQPPTVLGADRTPQASNNIEDKDSTLLMSYNSVVATGGTGIFQPHPTTPSFDNGDSQDVALGDLDGDGDLDAVVANASDEAETVWLNDGAGNFSAHDEMPAFGDGDSVAVVLSDIDGDGDLDAVVVNADIDAVTAPPNTVWVNDGAGSFDPHPTTPSFGGTLAHATHLALGDIDGDGDLDAVVAIWKDDPLPAAETVWLNDGLGNFSPHPDAPSFGEGQSTYVSLGDIDGDGDLDAVVANAAGGAQTVWLNDGNGIFSAHSETSAFGAGDSVGVLLGDIDGDSHLDAIVANASGEAETVWLNDSEGNFIAHPGTPSFDAGDAAAMALSDVDGNGHLDVVVSGDANTVWLNDGFGNVSGHPISASFGAGKSSGIVVGDLDGDGDVDAVVARQGALAETVWVNRNQPGVDVTPDQLALAEGKGATSYELVLSSQPTATVTISITHGEQLAVSPTSLTFDDTNWNAPQSVGVSAVEDEAVEGPQMATIWHSAASDDPLYDGLDVEDVTVHIADDSLTYYVPFVVTSPSVLYTNPAPNALDVAPTTVLSVTMSKVVDGDTVNGNTFRVWGAQTGLYNGVISPTMDSGWQFTSALPFKPGEVIWARTTGHIRSNEGVPFVPFGWQFTTAVEGGSGNFTAQATSPSFDTSNFSWGVTLGDLDNDGDLDAVFADGDSHATVWLNDSLGNFSPHPNVSSFGDSDVRGIALGDLDGDGDLDAVSANIDGPATIWLNDGSGNFGPHPDTPFINAGGTTDVALGDLDGDGDLDAVAMGSVWLNDGSGNLTLHPTTPFFYVGTLTGHTSDLALGDLDNDGDLDAVITNSDLFRPGQTVLQNDGAGNFLPHPTMSIFGNNGGASIALGDLDGDGDLDALEGTRTHQMSGIWLNDGLGHFIPHPDTPTIRDIWHASSVALVDVDGDGDLDAILTSNEVGYVWLNDGDGNFSTRTNSPNLGGDDTRDFAVGDLDGDGDLDVVLAIVGLNEVWLNDD